MEYINRPLVQRLEEFNQEKPVSFHVPGHKHGELSGLPPALRSALSFDFTEISGLDDLHQPEDVIADAQDKLMELYNTDASFFLVNGSTVGNLAMIYATCRAGDTVIVQRNAHKSVFNALELVDARPVLIAPDWDEETASAGTVSARQVRLALEQYPNAKAVILTYPTYYGTTGEDLKEIIAMCHKQDVPVLVDEAHGAHFVIGEPFPTSALALGADVVVHSAHKTLPAMTMASFLHVKSTLVSKERISKYLQMLQSSSPSYLLMASLDDARAYAESFTRKDVTSFLNRREKFINRLNHIASFQVIESNDPLKLMGRVENYTGFQLLKALEKESIYVELADPFQVLLILPLLKKGQLYDIETICNKIERAVKWLHVHEEKKNVSTPPITVNQISELCYNRSELEQFQVDWVQYNQTVGMIAAASIIPYPPGIPLLLAGERITEEHVELLITLTTMEASFQGAIRTKEKQILVVMNEVEE
ncbi:aminotransferase class I/II-fold pyridoxal phosphate-dependent enzyme [Sporosarcina ureilytica]|uniref:Lysine decarboxylase n=1 Tax=Sporosarcina ureilytica TaxID=298596 RepID=A0A1D8JCA5_9BACL|nr:aminotransferase class I/II-fold pyridoxal phosphate-dependent enzyme [Sporosarcina ureilytica]AOV06332.1 lysine decarboxylase [Sporosarcina ureilytica]